VNRIVESVKQRRAARRWQRWSENDPLDEMGERARWGVIVFFAIVVLLVAAVVFALVPR
jgi:cytochrome c-type biogenesis protein CcmH/NrfG